MAQEVFGDATRSGEWRAVFPEDGICFCTQQAAEDLPLPTSGGLGVRMAGPHIYTSEVPVTSGCPGPDVIIDRFDLWRQGAHAIWLGEKRVRVESVNTYRGDRPWVPGAGGGGRACAGCAEIRTAVSPTAATASD